MELAIFLALKRAPATDSATVLTFRVLFAEKAMAIGL
jgi:hypothetical protein